MAKDEKIMRHIGNGYAQTETGRVIFSNDQAQVYASDSADESSTDVQPYANWHPIFEKPPKPRKAVVPETTTVRGEDLKIKWGYAEWTLVGTASLYGLVMFYPDVYWYEFEFFTENLYLQTDYMSYWVTGMGHTAEAFPYSGLYQYLDLDTFPDPRPQLDDIIDPEEETPSEHFQFTLGEEAEATYYNPAMGYDTRWDWISAGGLYTNIPEHAMPDYHIVGPMYPESQDQGESVGGRLYFIYPRPPHNTYHGYGEEDDDGAGGVEYFTTDCDIHFDYYESIGNLIEVKDLIDTFKSGSGGDSPWATLGTFNYSLTFEHETTTSPDPEDPEITLTHSYLRMIFDAPGYHFLAAPTAPDERVVDANTTFEFHTIDIPIKGYVIAEDLTNPSFHPYLRDPIPEEGDLTFNWTLHVQGRWVSGNPQTRYYTTGTNYGTEEYMQEHAGQLFITFQVAIPGDEDLRTLPVVTVPVSYESSHEEEVRDYDYLVFKKGSDCISFLEQYPLRRGGWYGYADGGSRKSLFFSEEAFDSTIHYSDPYRTLDCVRAQYISDLTSSDFNTTVEGGKHKGKFYQVYPPLIQPLYETEIYDNGTSYEYTPRGSLSIDLIKNFASRGMGMTTVYGWPIARLEYLESYPIALEIELEDENHIMTIRGDFSSISDWDDPVEYAAFRTSCIEVILTGAMFKFAKSPDSTSFRFSGYAWLYRERWYSRALGSGVYECFYRHVTTQGNREIRIYPEKGTYIIEEP